MRIRNVADEPTRVSILLIDCIEPSMVTVGRTDRRP